MVLGYSELRKRISEQDLIENFSEDCIEGSGYDLRVDRLYRLASDGFIGVTERRTPEVEEIAFEGRHCLKPGEYILIESLEKVNMPVDLMARILPRSSLFRCGCSLGTAVVDPGFKGTLTMGLRNNSSYDFLLERGGRVAQIVFEDVRGTAKTYEGRYQGGKVV